MRSWPRSTTWPARASRACCPSRIPTASRDPVATLLETRLADAPAPFGAMLAAAWRAGLEASAEGAPDDDVRVALRRLSGP